MEILSCIHLYPPYHVCGAEMMIHQIHKHLQSEGHTIKVLVKMSNKVKVKNHYVYDGVDVFGADDGNEMNLFRNADIVMTHLDYSAWTQEMASIHGIPCVHIIHNDYVRQHIIDASKVQYVVYNSQWIAKKLAYDHLSFVLHPPTDWRHYDLNIDPWDNEFITLINLDENKGGHILTQIAKAMPDVKFCGVIGSYSQPSYVGQHIVQPLNVTVMDTQQDIRKVYERTKILIMPSEYESWGRTATEAMCSGIPVISTATEGLVENCGNAGIFVKDRNDIEQWVKQIKRLYNEKAYTKASQKAKARSRELDPKVSLHGFEVFLRKAKEYYPFKKRD